MAAEHFNQIIGRALIDPEFQQLLLNNLPEAVRGFDLNPSELDILGSLNESNFRPPKVTFTWGPMPTFKGVVEGLSVKYTMFLPDGTPTRATVNLKMKQADKLLNKKQAESANKQASGDDGLADSQKEPVGSVNKIEAIVVKQKIVDDNIGEKREADFTLPEVSDEVLVAFEHGDIDQPVVLGSVWNTGKLPNLGDKQAGLFDGEHHDKHHSGDSLGAVDSTAPQGGSYQYGGGQAVGKEKFGEVDISKKKRKTPVLSIFVVVVLIGLIIVLGWWWMNNNGTFTADPCAPGNQTATAVAFVAGLTTTPAAGGINRTGDRAFFIDETGVIRAPNPCDPTPGGSSPLSETELPVGGSSSTTGGGTESAGCGCQGTDYVCDGSVRYNVAECGGSGGCECRGPDLACPDGSYGAFNPQCTGGGDACFCICDQTDPLNVKICLQGHDSCDPTISCLP